MTLRTTKSFCDFTCENISIKNSSPEKPFALLLKQTKKGLPEITNPKQDFKTFCSRTAHITNEVKH